MFNRNSSPGFIDNGYFNVVDIKVGQGINVEKCVLLYA